MSIPTQSILVVLAVLVVALTGYADWLTAQKLSLYVFYSLPIFLGAWFVGRKTGILCSLASACSWLLVDLELRHSQTWMVMWNAGLRLCVFIGISSIISLLKSNMLREKKWADTDFLTQIPNRRTFNILANHERQNAIRHKRPLSLAYFDLDDFKEINDRAGHDVGDLFLVDFAAVLKTNIRDSDAVARVGGDEFVVLLPETDFESALVVLRKLNDSLKEEMQKRNHNVSVSIGAVTYKDYFPEIQEMLLKADQLMYKAKKSGKNKILHELVCSLDKP